jgi:flagellar biosynthesis anti-sigma factor FlgM
MGVTMAGSDKLEGLPEHAPNISSSQISTSREQSTKNSSTLKPAEETVALSPETTEYAHVLKRINEVPDIRSKRIEKIRKSLEEGTYDIAPHLVADRIIQETINESSPAKKRLDSTNPSKPS